MKTAILVALFALFLVGCLKKELQTVPTNNPNYSVQKLFTHEGCTVYRFRDGGDRYYTDCRGETITMRHNEDEGTRSENIPTN